MGGVSEKFGVWGFLGPFFFLGGGGRVPTVSTFREFFFFFSFVGKEKPKRPTSE